MLRRKLFWFTYHCPSARYTSDVITPRPTKLAAARIVGTFKGYHSNSVSVCNKFKVSDTYIANELCVIELYDRGADEISAAWEPYNRWDNGT